MKQRKIKRKDLLQIPIEQIIIDKNWNVRFDYGDLKTLKNSIKESGQMEPIKVRKIKSGQNKGMYQVIEGHRRMTVLTELYESGDHDGYILAINVNKNATNEDNIFEMLVSGMTKKQLEPLEIADGIGRLSKQGYEGKEIAQKMGVSGGYVSMMITLYNSPDIAKEYVKSGKIKYKDILPIIRFHNNKNIHEDLKKNLDEYINLKNMRQISKASDFVAWLKNQYASNNENQHVYEALFKASYNQEPVDQEPVDQEPVDQEPVDQEPVDQEPVDQEPVDQEPVDQEPVDQEPGDQEPGDQFNQFDAYNFKIDILLESADFLLLKHQKKSFQLLSRNEYRRLIAFKEAVSTTKEHADINLLSNLILKVIAQ